MSDVHTVKDFAASRYLKQCRREREEILRHKWIESEKAGHDIGDDRAILDWAIHHRSTFRREQTA